MPVLTSKTLGGSSYGYSATRIGDLGASEYTLVTLVVDSSGSVSGFARDLEACVAEVVRACLRAPRSDNTMLRVVRFDHRLKEVHGYKPLTAVQPDDYAGCVKVGGSTALFDATTNAVEAMRDYGRELADHGFAANGLVVVITDGEDNASTATAAQVGRAIQQCVVGEVLESVVSILVGVGVSQSGVGQALVDFSARAGFDHYLGLDSADADTFSRLADFVTRSVVAQSTALGSGGPSTLLVF